jgi:hypothetical protein
MTIGASASRVVADSFGAFPDTQLLRIRDLVYDGAGIFHPDHNLVRFEGYCRRQMQQIGSATLADHFDCLAVNPSCQAEFVNLLNALIYFDMLSKQRVLRHFYNCLLPQGYFFQGAAESLFGSVEDFTLVHFPGATGYSKAPRRALTRQLS